MQARAHHQKRSSAVLLTGATGFVGMELLARFPERTDRQYFDRLAEFALRAEWGRRQISRASLTEGAVRRRAGPRRRAARARAEVYA
jgi:nucleoside-diphosphate-sugar epimerase